MYSQNFQQAMESISYHIFMCVRNYILVTHELQYISYNLLTISSTFIQISVLTAAT